MISLALVSQAPMIRSVAPDRTSVAVYNVVDYTVKLDAEFENPFDPSDIALDATAVTSDGTMTVPGFYTQEFERSTTEGKETLKPAGEASWHVRISPRSKEPLAITFRLKTKTGSASFGPITITPTAPATPGAIQVSKKDSRFFAFQDGSSYWPLGPNLCWGNDGGTTSYDTWIPKLADQGANYGRLWLAPGWSTFGLDQKGKFGQIDLGNAWRLDYVMDLARKNGLYLMLCIESYNILRTKDGYPYWPEAVENHDNGGPLFAPREFWTNAKMAQAFKDKLRYLVARYGAYDQTMAWEFWNEVDLTDEFDIDRVREWHAGMAEYLHSIDPYHRLITTSFASSTGYKPIDLMPGLDYFQTHHYGGDPAMEVVMQQSRKGGQGRPHYVGEIGADAGGPRTEDDPTGVQVHDPIWASIASGSSGAAASWWWDNLIAPKNLYPLYGAASRFLAGVEWDKQGFRQTKPSFAFATKTAPQMKDLEFSGPVSWSRSPANSPRTVRIDKNGKASGDLPLPGILHGRQNHSELYNPIYFVTSFEKAVKFELEVGEVSGYGGSGFQIYLDGSRLLSRTFADPDGNEKTESLKQYEGKFQVTVPPGDHTLAIASTGPDWFLATYRFLDLIPRTSPPLEGWSVVGESVAMAWVRREGRTWKRAIEGQSASPPAVIGLTGLATGRWKVELWDTWKGEPTQTTYATVKLDGKVRVNLPSISKDIAVKLTRQ
jgi:hypothetical protein